MAIFSTVHPACIQKITCGTFNSAFFQHHVNSKWYDLEVCVTSTQSSLVVLSLSVISSLVIQFGFVILEKIFTHMKALLITALKQSHRAGVALYDFALKITTSSNSEFCIDGKIWLKRGLMYLLMLGKRLLKVSFRKTIVRGLRSVSNKLLNQKQHKKTNFSQTLLLFF